MANYITHELYNGDVIIYEYPDSHRYKKKGDKSYLTSVTAVTGLIDKSRVLIPWAVGLYKTHLLNRIQEGETYNYSELEMMIDEGARQYEIEKDKATNIGSRVHNFAEEFALNKLKSGSKAELHIDEFLEDVPEEEQSGVIKGINAFLDWYNSKDITFVEAEKVVYSLKHDFVGKADVVAWVDGKLKMIDYKTSKGIYSEHYYQASGYRLAYEEESGNTIDEIEILKFGKTDGELETHTISDRQEDEKNANAFLGLLQAKRREKELNRKK